MKRVLVAIVIFVAALTLLLMPSFIGLYRYFQKNEGTGIGFVVGSPAENIFRILVLLGLAIVAFWLSGKLVRV